MPSGSVRLAGLQSDINLMIDPEGLSIAFTATFSRFTVVGNAANQVTSTEAILDDIRAIQNRNKSLLYRYCGTDSTRRGGHERGVMAPGIMADKAMEE